MWTAARISHEELHQFWLACEEAGFAPDSFSVRAERLDAGNQHDCVVTVSRGRRAISVADLPKDSWLTRAIAAVSAGMLGRPVPLEAWQHAVGSIDLQASLAIRRVVGSSQAYAARREDQATLSI